MATYAAHLRDTGIDNTTIALSANGKIGVRALGIGTASIADDAVTAAKYAPYKAGTTASAADALAVPVTHAIVTKTTGADAEALTLANGVAGQVLTIVLSVDGGGDGTLTPTTKTGFATIVFADAGDSATLKYIDDTVGWVIIGISGLTANPVVTM